MTTVTMRISTAWQHLCLAEQIGRLQRQMHELQLQISTGKRVNRPLDDPVAASQILGARGSRQEIEAQEKVIVEGRMLVRYADQALAEVGSVLRRTRDLLVRAMNDSLSQAAREGIAHEVDEILSRLVRLGNSQIHGRYVFGGKVDRRPPLVWTGDPANPVAYQGSSQEQQFRIGESAWVPVVLAGDRLFNFEDENGRRAIAGLDKDLFGCLAGVRDAIRSGNSDLMEEGLAELDAFIEHIVQAQAEVGVNDRRLSALERVAEQEDTRFAELLSTLEDCDLAEAITRLRLLQVVYEATLGVTAKAAALPTLVEMGW